MSTTPKGIKGTRRKLREAKMIATAAVHGAMMEASKTIDQQAAELMAMRRILISERAQVIYYSDKYRESSPAPKGFLELTEDQQADYAKKAIHELNGDTELAPHGSQGAKLIVN